MLPQRSLAYAVACACLLGCGGSSPVAPSAPLSNSTPEPTFTLSGTVRDDSGQAVSGALVTILDGVDINRSITSDSAGGFSLTALRSGGFTLQVSRSGYDPVRRSVTLTNSISLDVTIARTRLNLSGSWRGAYEHADRTTRSRTAFVMAAAVVQTGTAVSATFTIGEGELNSSVWIGSFVGTLNTLIPQAQFTGTLTINALISTGTGRCNATHSVTGTMSAGELMLSAPGVWTWEQCVSSIEDIVMILNR